ncbi:snurportin-1 [Solanum tuberosum]|uniref:Snurportin-1 n=1 Tax=Solanum tuberosum TaxID=4113 RepID=M1AVV4_SOLTU|nr:PREDICTED: snurportin-1 [Solanum tuberosum]XP_006343774.1 PREDICTED: snurportin-1 [Solanum tuberosum]
MSSHDIRRPFKRPAISDQQRRRELSLLRQSQNRHDAQLQARRLASTLLSLQSSSQEQQVDIQVTDELESCPEEIDDDYGHHKDSHDLRQATKLRGPDARLWFAKQLMLPEWMIDVPDKLNTDWYVFARPAGKRCFVVSSNGTTISRLRNGVLLHRFPSALPNGARTNNSKAAQSYCILDCIFHESDETYYVIDGVCWAGISLYECTAEFRFFWLNSKLAETGACDVPSTYHKYKFSALPVYNCDKEGLQTAYAGQVPYVKDGLLFYNKHAQYQTGNTPLSLVWKDEHCSQYVIDTDNKGQVQSQQQVVLELLDGGRLATSDDPPVIFGCLLGEFMQKTELHCGDLIKFAIGEGGLVVVDSKLEKADLKYLGKSNRARAFADSYSKVLFQHAARYSPLRIEHLFASISSYVEDGNSTQDAEMAG